MLSIGALSSAAQGASYYERDGYYAKDDPEHRDASAWAGKGAEELGLKGPVDADTFRAVLEGKVPDGSDTGSVGAARTGRSTTVPAATSPSPPPSRSPSQRSSATTSVSSRPTTAPWRQRSPGSRRTPPRPA